MDRNVNERQIVIIASPEKLKNLNKEVDWRTAIGLVAWPVGYAAYKYFSTETPYPYPVFDLKASRNTFEFPVNHPVDGQVYACCEASPDLYVPFAFFHQYMYQSKMAAFLKICADLGAKRCKVTYAEENGKDISANFGVSDIPTEMGNVSGDANVSSKKHSSSAAAVFAEFPQPKGQIKGSSSRWMNGEPTWIAMQESRLGNGLDKFRAEFTYSDDLGIKGDLAAKISKIGLSIGGKYEEMSRKKWVFDVEFWPC